MHIHILGICGTFMAGIARLARELGHRVTGSDNNAWPPMSDQLAAQGIDILPGYQPEHLHPAPDCVLIGNALSRGNPAVEYVLNQRLTYTSGPAWLAQNVLHDRWVLAIAGTHGKTTTSAMASWILEQSGLSPGFLIGGVPRNFSVSARLGAAPFFVVEADEYDTAFFDKRSKFVHYPAQTLVISNIEHDHADIFHDLGAILRQFHHLIRIIPGDGLVVAGAGQPNIETLLAEGCWTPTARFGAVAQWTAAVHTADGSDFDVLEDTSRRGRVRWSLIGQHNVNNALAALVACRHAGVPVEQGCEALSAFENVKRRLEQVGKVDDVTVYDDFAHHPTAIAATLQALRSRVGDARIVAVLEPRSNSMRLGLHRDTLGASLVEADETWVLEPLDLAWDLAGSLSGLGASGHVESTIDAIIKGTIESTRPGDHILIMSNGDFGGIHHRLLEKLKS